MCPAKLLIFAILLCMFFMSVGVIEYFYVNPTQPNDGRPCKLHPHFHGDHYCYQNHQFKLANQRGMKIGYGYSHDLRSNANWTSFPIILYTWNKCPYCIEFEKSGTWEKLQKEYGNQLKFQKVQRENAPEVVNSFPTIMANVDGNLLKYEGNRSHNDMRQWINGLLIKRA